MKMGQCLSGVFVFVGLLVFWSASVSAYQCNQATGLPNDWLDPNGDETAVYYYFQENMHDSFLECTPNSAYQTDVSETYLYGRIKEAAEIWNTQSAGPSLIYRGETPSEMDEFCNDPNIQKPAVLIDFREGCRLINCEDECDNDGGPCECEDGMYDDPDPLERGDCTSAGARVWGLSGGCDDAIGFTIFGSRSEVNSCNTPINWALEFDEPSGNSLTKLAVHEFGHVLNLGHELESGVVAAMTQFQNAATGRNLHDWDKVCVREVAAEREITYRYQEHSSSAVWGYVESGPSAIRGSISNGHWLNDTGAFIRYGVYSDLDLYYAQHYSSLNLSQYNSGLTGSIFTNLHTNPVFFNRRASSVGADEGEHQRMNITQSYLSGSTEEWPPILRYGRSDDFFDYTYYGHYYICENAGCTSRHIARSHVPLVYGYDPITDTELFVRVDNTDRADGGEIVVHPGLHGTNRYRLIEGSEMTSNTTLPSHSGSTFSYVGKTSFAPGVACHGDTSTSYDYNCLLAWVDRGVPGGRVVYTYFRIDPISGDVEWRGLSSLRGGSATASNVSAAAFNGHLWMTWKGWDHPHERVWTSRDPDSSYGSWSLVNKIDRQYMVDPPSFFFTDWNATRAAVAWGEDLPY